MIVLLTTGASDTNKKINIYDLAGNIAEMTLEMEKYSNTKTCNFYRGGSAWSLSDTTSVTERRCYDFNQMRSYAYGFRVSIY